MREYQDIPWDVHSRTFLPPSRILGYRLRGRADRGGVPNKEEEAEYSISMDCLKTGHEVLFLGCSTSISEMKQ